LLPTFGHFTKGLWSFLFFNALLAFESTLRTGYEPGKAKSNSLLYLYNADTDKASWATYDVNLDSWTKEYLGENPKPAKDLNQTPLFSKYNLVSLYRLRSKKTTSKPTVAFLKDSTAGNKRYLKIRISPNRAVNRYDIFANKKMEFMIKWSYSHQSKDTQFNRKGKKLLSYYVVDNAPEMEFNINAGSVFDMELMESSFDFAKPIVFNYKRASG
jgi:hypothetical protein